MMGVSHLSSVSSLQQYRAYGGAQSRNKTEQSAGTEANPAITLPGDTVEISQAGMDAYIRKETEQSPDYQNMIRELTNIQNNVLAHEQAHMSVGGDLAGSASYTYTKGPDGKEYITGGEVPISMPTTTNKEEMLKELEQIRRAALAPADPSSQDLSVAAEASAKEAALRSEVAAEKMKNDENK